MTPSTTSSKRTWESLGLDPPKQWFDGVAKATGTSAAISKAIKDHGDKVISLRQLPLLIPALASSAGILEFTVGLAGVLATAYLAACVGSLLVATGQTVIPAYLPPEVWRQVPHVRARLRGQR